jgi:hypothetical protein
MPGNNGHDRLPGRQPINENAPDSVESWDASSNSPPPKSAHHQPSCGAAACIWLGWATLGPGERDVQVRDVEALGVYTRDRLLARLCVTSACAPRRGRAVCTSVTLRIQFVCID